jgi:hypothetical protein
VRSCRTFSPLPHLQLKGSATACACFALAPGSSRTALTVRLTRSRTSQAQRACACFALASGSKANWLAPFTYVRRYILCGTFRKVALTPPSRTLSGTLLCGVRTFLSLRSAARETPASATQTATIRFDISCPYYKMDSGSKGLIPHRQRPENAFTTDLH